MFSQLGDKLQGVFKDLRGHGKISEANIDAALREIRMALLEADVDFKVTKEFIAAVKEEALGEKVLRSVTPGQQFVKIFHDALAELLGHDAAPLDLSRSGRILIVGLNGAGKTTTSGKLAYQLQKKGKRPLLIALDLARPAAIDQLATLGEQIGVPVFRPQPGERDVLAAAKASLAWISEQPGDIPIFDTAGRQEVDDSLIEELRQLKEFLQPSETLLVSDAATGQQAVDVATRFRDAIGLSGLILTKLDGDARGGAALSMRRVTGCPIKFGGIGEKIDQLETFHPDRMASRILGMGDVVSLVEKAGEAIEEEEAEKLGAKLAKGAFDLEDFLAQMKMMRKMGPLENLLGMLPGMGNVDRLPVDERKIKHLEAIILSMTPRERKRPQILNGRRRSRIAKGSGRPVSEVNNLMRNFTQMKKMFKKRKNLKKMLRRAGGGGAGDLAQLMQP